MTPPLRPYILPAAVVILSVAAVLSVPAVIHRARSERLNNRVEIGIDASDVPARAAREGIPAAVILVRIKRAGAASAVISEMTLAEAVFRGFIDIERRDDGFALKTADERACRQLSAMLCGRYGLRVKGKELQKGFYLTGKSVPPWGPESPFGYDPALLDAARAAGMRVILRPSNVRGSQWVPEERCDGYVFDGPEVPGFPGNEKLFGQMAAAKGVRGVVFEFSKTKGREQLARSMSRFIVAGHTVTPAELENLTATASLLRRWQRAVRERGVRFLLVRPLPALDFDDNLRYIGAVVKGLEDKGYSVESTEPPGYPETARLPLNMAVIALTALSVPLIAMAAGLKARTPLAGFVTVNILTLAGAFILAACLYDGRFMQRLIPVPGIKLCLLFPVAVMAVFLYRGNGLAESLKRPLTSGQAVMAFMAAGAVYILLARSGNDAAAWMRPETGIREWLETILPVRPRTKEFLFAQPLLFAGFATRRKLLIAAGSLAPVSVLNTFFHAHTPFIISLQRSIIGMAAGLILGYILVIAIKKAELSRRSP